jgi:hypothetical protein
LEVCAKEYLDNFEAELRKRILKSAESTKRNQPLFCDDDKEIIHHWHYYKKLIDNYEEKDEYSHQVNYRV